MKRRQFAKSAVLCATVIGGQLLAAPAMAQKQDTVKVGLILSMTGPFEIGRAHV